MKKQREKLPKREQPKNSQRSGIFKGLLKVFLIIVIVFLVFVLVFSYFGNGEVKKRKAKSGWQAVFLTNNQVYFGHIEKADKKEVILKDIYYLRMAGSLQQGEKPTEFSLVKLGEELHGPVDEMQINRDHILFVEYLKNDSKVVQAIRKHISQSL